MCINFNGNAMFLISVTSGLRWTADVEMTVLDGWKP